MRQIIFISCVLFLTACGPKITKKQQIKLNELELGIDSIVSNVISLDSVKTFEMISNFQERKNFVQVEMTDTIERETLFKLDEFVQLRKGMGYLLSEYSGIKFEALTMQSQIKDLMHDVEHRLVEEKQFDRYYDLEKTNLDQLKFASERLVDIDARMQVDYAEKVEMVDSLISAYKIKVNE